MHCYLHLHNECGRLCADKFRNPFLAFSLSGLGCFSIDDLIFS